MALNIIHPILVLSAPRVPFIARLVANFTMKVYSTPLDSLLNVFTPTLLPCNPEHDIALELVHVSALFQSNKQN